MSHQMIKYTGISIATSYLNLMEFLGITIHTELKYHIYKKFIYEYITFALSNLAKSLETSWLLVSYYFVELFILEEDAKKKICFKSLYKINLKTNFFI